MGDALRIDAQLQIGQGIQPVRLGPALADQHLRPNVGAAAERTIAWKARSDWHRRSGWQRDIDR